MSLPYPPLASGTQGDIRPRRARPAAIRFRARPRVARARLVGLAKILRLIVLAILLVRAVCDPLFDLSKYDFGGLNIGIGAAFNALVIAIALAFIALRPRTFRSPWVWMWAPFLLVALGSISLSPDPIAALRTFLVLTSYWAMFTIGAFLLFSGEGLSGCVWIVLLSSIVPTLYAFGELGFGDPTGPDGLRLQSTFSHANIFAFYLVLILALVLFLLKGNANPLRGGLRRLLLAYVPILLGLLVLTKTRSAWLGGGLVILLYSVRIDRRFFVYIIVALALALFEPSIGERLLDLEQGNDLPEVGHLTAETRLNSYAWRTLLWQSALTWIEVKPVLGHGLDSFRVYSPEFFALAPEDQGIDSHSVYIQILFEMGILGLLSFALLMVGLLAKLRQGLRADRSGFFILLILTLSYLLESYADNMIYYLAFNWYFWFVMGAACAWVQQRAANSAESARSSADRQRLPSIGSSVGFLPPMTLPNHKRSPQAPAIFD